jgi:hypothetical protein
MATPKLPLKTWSTDQISVARPPERSTNKFTADSAKNTSESTGNALETTQIRNSVRLPPKRGQTTETLVPPLPTQDDVQKNRPIITRPSTSVLEPKFTSLRGISRPDKKLSDKPWSSNIDVIMEESPVTSESRQAEPRQPDALQSVHVDKHEDVARPPIRAITDPSIPLLSTFSSQEQEARIVNDLLYIFLGCDANYIRPHRPEDHERKWTLVQDEDGNAWEIDTTMGTLFPLED